jgi:hypothetical protein
MPLLSTMYAAFLNTLTCYKCGNQLTLDGGVFAVVGAPPHAATWIGQSMCGACYNIIETGFRLVPNLTARSTIMEASARAQNTGQAQRITAAIGYAGPIRAQPIAAIGYAGPIQAQPIAAIGNPGPIQAQPKRNTAARGRNPTRAQRTTNARQQLDERQLNEQDAAEALMGLSVAAAAGDSSNP